MKYTTAVVALAALLAAASVFQLNKVNSLSQTTVELTAFAQYVKEHGKQYNTPEEYMYRFEIFKERYAEVRDHSQKNGLTYEIELNKFSDLTKEEFLVKHTGLRINPNAVRNPVYLEETGLNADSVDWVAAGAVNPIKDQARCGSCWAFSAVASTEAAWQIAGNPLTSLSEQELVDCSVSYGNHGCNGGLMDYAFRFIKAKGLELESIYTYTAKNGRCHLDKSKTVAHISGYTDVPRDNGQQLRLAAQKTVVSVAIDAYGIMQYKSGVFNGSCGTQLNHGVAVVGYGTDAEGGDFWTVRNSWGAGYGEQGYVRMTRSDARGAGICGILMQPSYALA